MPMKIGVRAGALIVAATVAATLVSGCGAGMAGEAGSFADAGVGVGVGTTNTTSGAHVSAELGDAGTFATELPEENAEPIHEGQSQGEAHQTTESLAKGGTQQLPESLAETGTQQPSEDPNQAGTQQLADNGAVGGQLSGEPAASGAPPKGQPKSGADSQSDAVEEAVGRPEKPSTATKPSGQSKPPATITKPTATVKPSQSGTTGSNNQNAQTPSISWSGFFDNEDQTTPSEKFWDLSDERATVRIKGFMGEVLSIRANWFLLIPEPGAECPFDNGDETYWNKIMIIFVKDGAKLRYTSKPLELTGRLDVGIKVDESGYKTMFRLYDATLKEIKD